ncbi:MAG: molybdate ABC transporter substrate-binding protein [Pseudomonadota bacterium]|nr:molybdate ABC transporter substrate-binding protein [Pseudomonadota bacterium]
MRNLWFARPYDLGFDNRLEGAVRLLKSLSVTLAAAFALASPVLASEVSVAVAANFTEPAKEIGAAFQKATGNTLALSSGPSGGFYTQISHGAPFEVFLSADAERPAKAQAEGFAVPGTRFTYAVGRLVLYSKTPGLVDGPKAEGGGAVLKAGRFEHLSIADPKTAPYGAAAIETMTKLGVYDGLKPKIVQGASIAQAYEFTATGAAELGFVALSQVIKVEGGSRWIVPESLHTPIVQDAVLLKPGANDPAAKGFLAFLKGPQAREIIKRYGYDVK